MVGAGGGLREGVQGQTAGRTGGAAVSDATVAAECGQAACTAEERCTPEMRARMAELLSLVT
jgi:hypothetical protein